MKDIVTNKLIISGVVQGVGMRFFINRTAKRFGIRGYVKNLYNGNVECLVQANYSVIEDFIKYIKRNSPGVIDNVIIEEMIDYKELTKFQVKLF